jgi:hypothetical protein
VSHLRAAAAIAVALCLAAPAASAHEGNPNFRSTIRAIEPPARGVTAEIVNYDDSIALRNTSGRTVVVEGYEGEPYVRISPDGTVAVNHDAPTYFLNEDRFAEGVEVPKRAGADAPPDWQVVDRTGRYVWHDHRIHWMSRSTPPQVKDESERTTVLDWKVPLTVGGERTTIAGSLIWVGEPASEFPLGAAVALGVVLLGGAAFVVIVRRRRRGERPEREAW